MKKSLTFRTIYSPHTHVVTVTSMFTVYEDYLYCRAVQSVTEKGKLTNNEQKIL